MICQYDIISTVSQAGIRRQRRYLHLIHTDILHAGVLEILTKATNGDAISANACHILDVDIVRSRLDGDAVISTLVHKIGELDVHSIPGICELRSAGDIQLTSVNEPNPSVFCTQLEPYGASTDIALQ
jgi:hypothetical protein